MARCDRCGREPQADLTRYEALEGEDRLVELLLCPECAYGLNTMMAEYVATPPAPTLGR